MDWINAATLHWDIYVPLKNSSCSALHMDGVGCCRFQRCFGVGVHKEGRLLWTPPRRLGGKQETAGVYRSATPLVWLRRGRGCLHGRHTDGTEADEEYHREVE